jgi:tetratricopeptide (TPR) repeat protein
MHAFGLEECGDYVRAEEFAKQALALNPFDARAHHTLAHVFEMTGRAAAGVQWLHEHIEYWATGTVVATHCWWHMALFHLAQGQIESALSLYDTRVRASQSRDVADMIDAAALLWRIELQGGRTGARWNELAAAWAPHIADGFCTFNDLHAMVAFVGARDWNLAQRLERELAQRQSS